MAQTLTINILYHNNADDPETHQYTQNISLDPGKYTQDDYFAGSQRNVQMDTLSFTLTQSLPAASTIASVNSINYNNLPLSNFVDLLKRHDDFLATALFENNVAQAAPTAPAAQEPAEASEAKTAPDTQAPKAADVINIADQASASSSSEGSSAAPAEPEQPEASSTLDSKNAYLLYQPQGHRNYKRIDFADATKLDPQDKIKSIGSSELITPITYKSLADLSQDIQVKMFNNPVNLIPISGAITDRRRETFAKKAGLDEHALDSANVEKLANVTAVNGKQYKLVALVDPAKLTSVKPETKTAEVTDNVTNTAKTTSAPSATDDTQAQPITPTTDLAPDILEQLSHLAKDHREILARLAGEPDATDIPQEILDTAKTLDTPQKSAAYLFDIINKLATNTLPESLKTLSDPTIFLKVVNYISWPKSNI